MAGTYRSTPIATQAHLNVRVLPASAESRTSSLKLLYPLFSCHRAMNPFGFGIAGYGTVPQPAIRNPKKK